MVARQHGIIGWCPERALSKTARQMSMRFEVRLQQQHTYCAWLHTVVRICMIMLWLRSHMAPEVNAGGLLIQCKHNHLPTSPIFFMAQLQGNTAVCSTLWYYRRDDEMERFMKVKEPNQPIWSILLCSDLNTYLMLKILPISIRRSFFQNKSFLNKPHTKNK